MLHNSYCACAGHGLSLDLLCRDLLRGLWEELALAPPHPTSVTDDSIRVTEFKPQDGKSGSCCPLSPCCPLIPPQAHPAYACHEQDAADAKVDCEGTADPVSPLPLCLYVQGLARCLAWSRNSTVQTFQHGAQQASTALGRITTLDMALVFQYHLAIKLISLFIIRQVLID